MGNQDYILKKFSEYAEKLNNIKNLPFSDINHKDYDKVGFVHDVGFIIDQLDYFFDDTMPHQTGIANTSYYPLSINPLEHQVIYVNLTRGYPKELFGGHWCYILKKFEHKYIVIPTTSVDNPEQDSIQNFEVDIKIHDFIDDKLTRLNLSSICSIDLQRIYAKKGIYDVETPRSFIIEKIKDILLSNSVDNSKKDVYNIGEQEIIDSAI